MVHIAVCDDSTEFRRILEGSLRRNCPKFFPKTLSYELGVGLGSGSEVLRYLQNKKIDVLFLDIDMPDMNGIDLAKRLVKTQPEMLIIFVTGFDQFVYEVFEFSPFAFLRKENIVEGLPKILKRLAYRLDAENWKITLNTINGEKIISARDALFVRSNRNYYEVHMISGKVYSCRGTMKMAAQLFLPYDFCQIHSAYIVNMDAIERIDRENVYMGEDNIRIPIAQHRSADFKKAYAAFTLRGISE